MVLKKKTRFEYTPRTTEQLQKRANQSGSARESFIRDSIKMWTPTTGKNRIRFLPPTFENPEHYGIDCYIHYSIGPDNSAFVCLNHLETLGFENQDCPICRARLKAERNGDEELAAALKPNKRVLTYIIDRSKPQDGPLVWSMAWTLDRNITARCIDDDDGTAFSIDDPEAGHDVRFTREGKDQLTKYIGEEIVRKSTPLSDDEREQDEWINFVLANPLTDIVVIPDPEDLVEALSGGVRRKSTKEEPSRRRSSRDDEDEDDPRPARRRARDDTEDDDPPPRRRARDDEDEDARPVSRRRAVEEDEDPRPARRRPPADDEDEPPPRRRQRDEDVDEVPRRRRPSDADDDEPPRRRAVPDSEDEVAPTRKKLTRRGTEDEDEDVVKKTDDEEDAPRARASTRQSTPSRDKASRDEDDEEEGPRVRRSEMRNKIETIKSKR